MSYRVDATETANSVEQRIRFLVLHYTQLDFHASLDILTKGKVSAHYLVPEQSAFNSRIVYRLVDETLLAHHAGESYWQGRRRLNDTSIGIEIVNLGFKNQYEPREWYPFEDAQIDTVVALCKDIIQRYHIQPTCVVAHSDIAPTRKEDPGPLFPWKKLAVQGIGAWYDEQLVQRMIQVASFKADPDIRKVQTQLGIYGYDIQITGELDEQTRKVLTAFQMHFRPRDYSGNPDSETCAILESLVHQYCFVGK